MGAAATLGAALHGTMLLVACCEAAAHPANGAAYGEQREGFGYQHVPAWQQLT